MYKDILELKNKKTTQFLKYGQRVWINVSSKKIYQWPISIFAQHQFSSVQFSRSVVSDSLWPHESQHAMPPCPSPTPRVYLNSCPSSRWRHPAISSSIVPFSSCPQSLPASGFFPLSQLFAWGGQSIGVSASASVQEHKSKPQRDTTSHLLGWLESRSQLITRIGKDVEKLEASCTGSRSVKLCSHLGKYFWQFLKSLNTELAYDPAIPLLGIYPKEMKIYVHT